MGTVLLIAALALPIVEKPATGGRPFVAVLLTGDGGWRAIDEAIARELNHRGIPVAGFLSNEYFATRRTPAEIGRDVERVIDDYTVRWNRPKVILIGFSRGADAIPIALSQMTAAERDRIALAVLLGPATEAELEVTPWWKFGAAEVPTIRTAPLMHSLRGMRFLCVHGEDESGSLCDALTLGEAIDLKTPGGHHFGGRYEAIAAAILASLPQQP